jgi:hypothetical protein
MAMGTGGMEAAKVRLTFWLILKLLCALRTLCVTILKLSG